MIDDTDKHVVELDFDNKNFEKNTKKSMSTLDKLKEKLDFGSLTKDLDKFTVSISKSEVVMMSAIQNITNRVVNSGIMMLKALTIDNVTAGWEKFAQKTTSVATMAAQNIKIAGKELTDYSEKMSGINDQLNLLNWFSDETSYSFTDMVNNVGKFTAAGQDLDTSVKAMEGIATWAALSGQNATTASRAMYQLAQAMGKGKIQLIDYKSIQNANMDTQEFRQTVLDTAVAIGQLTKAGENYVTKTGKKFTKNQFADSLESGWFTSDVLMKSLNKYSAAIDEIYSIAQKEGLTASEVIKKYGDQLDAFGVKAFKAAQEARTFRDVLNATADAVSSKWLQTFETIFGQYDDAKELWSDLADEFYDLFAEGGNFRNQVLDVWKELEGRADLFAHTGDDKQGAFWNIYDSIKAVANAVKEAWNEIFPKSVFENADDQAKDIGNNLKSFTARLQAITKRLVPTEEQLDRIKNILKGVFSVVKAVANAARVAIAIISPFISLAVNLLGKIGNVLSALGDKLSSFVSESSEKVYEFFTSVEFGEKVFGFIDKAIDGIKKALSSVVGFVKTKVIPFFKQIGSSTASFFKQIFDGANSSVKAFSPAVKMANKGATAVNEVNDSMSLSEKVLSGVSSVLTKIKSIGSSILSFLKKIPSLISSAYKELAGTDFAKSVVSAFKKIEATAKDIFSKIKIWVSGIPINLSKRFAELESDFSSALDYLKQIPEKMKPIANAIGNVFTQISKWFLKIPEMVSGALDNVNSVVKKSQKLFANVPDEKDSEEKLNPFKEFFIGIGKFLKGVVDLLAGLMVLAGKMLSFIGKVFSIIGDGLRDANLYLKGIGKDSDTTNRTLSEEEKKQIETIKNAKNILSSAIVLGGIALALAVVVKRITEIIKFTAHPVAEVADSLSGLLDKKAIAIQMDAVANLLRSFLPLAASIAIVASIDQTKLWQAVGALSTLAAVVGAISIAIVVLSKNASVATTAVGNAAKQFLLLRDETGKLAIGLKSFKSFSSDFKQVAKIGAIAGIISSFGSMMIKIAISMRILSKLEPDDIKKGVAVISIFLVELGAIAILLAKFSSNKDIANSSKSIGSVLGMSLLVLSFSKAIEKLARLDQGTMWSAVGAMATMVALAGAILISLAIISGKLEKANVEAKDVKRSTSALISSVSKAFSGLAVLLLSFSIAVSLISKLDIGRSWAAFGMLAAFMASVFGIIVGIAALAKNSNADFKSMSLFLMSFSATLTLLAVDLAILNLIPIIRSLISLAFLEALMWSMVAVLSVISKKDISKIKSASAFMLAFSASMIILSAALAVLNLLPIARTLVSLGMLAVLMETMALVISQVGNVNSKELKSISVLALALSGAMVALSAAMAVMNTMDMAKMIAAMAGIEAFLITIGAIISAISKSASNNSHISKTFIKNFMAMSSLIAIIAASIAGMIASIRLIANVPFNNLIAAMAGMVVFIAEMTAVISLMSMMSSKMKKNNLIKFAAVIVSFTVISVSLIPFAVAMKKLSSIPWKQMLVSLGVISGFMLTFAGLLMILVATGAAGGATVAGLLAFSAALLIASTGILVFVAALTSLSALPIKQIAVDILALCGAFVALGLVSAVITPMIPAMLALGAAITLVGLGLLTTSMAIAGLTTALVPFAETITSNITTISDSISLLITTLINALFDALQQATDRLTEFISNLLSNANELIPQIDETLRTFLDSALALIGDYLPRILDLVNNFAPNLIDTLGNIVMLVLDWMRNHARDMASKLLDILLIVLDKFTEYIPKIVKKLIKLIVVTVKALVNGLGSIVTMLVNILISITGLVLRLAVTLVGTLLKDLIIFLGALFKMIPHAIAGLADVIKETFRTVVFSVIKFIAEAIKTIKKDIVTAFQYIFGSIWNDFVEGLAKAAHWDVISNWLREHLKVDITDAETQINALASGSNISRAVDNAVNSISDDMDEANKKLKKSTQKGIQSTMSAFEDAFNEINGSDGNEITITPVIDNSELESGLDETEDIINNSKKNSSYDYGASTSASISRENASYSAMKSSSGRADNYSNVTNSYQPVFNIYGADDPTAVANAVNSKMYQMQQNSKLAKGKV